VHAWKTDKGKLSAEWLMQRIICEAPMLALAGQINLAILICGNNTFLLSSNHDAPRQVRSRSEQ
jgi:hypothetical protein